MLSARLRVFNLSGRAGRAEPRPERTADRARAAQGHAPGPGALSQPSDVSSSDCRSTRSMSSSGRKTLMSSRSLSGGSRQST